MANQKPHYAIIGGGIAGISLGIAMLKRNLSVTIYEAAAHFGEIGAGVAFTRNAIEGPFLMFHFYAVISFEAVSSALITRNRT